MIKLIPGLWRKWSSGAWTRLTIDQRTSTPTPSSSVRAPGEEERMVIKSSNLNPSLLPPSALCTRFLSIFVLPPSSWSLQTSTATTKTQYIKCHMSAHGVATLRTEFPSVQFVYTIFSAGSQASFHALLLWSWGSLLKMLQHSCCYGPSEFCS